MSCPELSRIQSTIETAREELRLRASEATTEAAGESAFSTWERVARTSLFSAEIDAQFHKARCPQCRQAKAAVYEPRTRELAQAA